LLILITAFLLLVLQYQVHALFASSCLSLRGHYKVTKTYQYDAFGVERNRDKNDINPYRYCCEYYDHETNQYY